MIREISEQNEHKTLSEFAAKSVESRGRKQAESKCDIRTEYQRDRDRIIHSKSFRRLKLKTQVFLSPEGDHYRTRLTHALEVSQIARTIARALRLNEDLTEAIALGHDLGHTPFGHCGEEILNRIHPGGFKHRVQGVRVVDYLEKRRNNTNGLNLTEEVRDGILNHSGSTDPFTLEGQIVKISDRIAYINHDIDDATRAGVLGKDSIPNHLQGIFGETHSSRINTMILNVIHNSMDKPKISMSDEIRMATNELRTFMFENVYLNLEAKKEEDKAREIISYLYKYFTSNSAKLPLEYIEETFVLGVNEAVKDFIAGMSDRYAINLFKELVIPEYWV